VQSTSRANNTFTLQSEIPPGLHVAIIMDGNGRWAARRGLPRVAGHRAGVAAARCTIEHAPRLGIRCLTLYAFSSDNWRRPEAEVRSIFGLLRAYLRLECAALRERGARVEVLGRRDRLPLLLRNEIERVESATRAGCELRLRVAIDYSSRDAITRAVLAATTPLRTSEPSEESLRGLLAKTLTAECGDVDLLIRTGGEKRLSDFLLWESAYAELVFTDRMWPDFDQGDLEAALVEFRRRERRFGGVPETRAQTPVLSFRGAR